ncbi:MAG: hypothetical protein ACK557_14910, partial [Planctomycetota bacterium]
ISGSTLPADPVPRDQVPKDQLPRDKVRASPPAGRARQAPRRPADGQLALGLKLLNDPGPLPVAASFFFFLFFLCIW